MDLESAILNLYLSDTCGAESEDIEQDKSRKFQSNAIWSLRFMFVINNLGWYME